MRRSRHSAFTILELIIVIGIIMLLAGILFPLVGRIKEAGKRTQCLGNLRSLTQAWLAYAGENNSRFCSSLRNTGDPGGITPGFYWGWLNTTPPNPLDIVRRGNLWSFVNNTDTFRCPDDTSSLTDNPSSYAVNGLLAGNIGAPFPFHKLDEIASAPNTFVFIEQAFPMSVKHGAISDTFATPLYPNPPILTATSWPGQNHKGAKAYAEGTAISFADGHALFWQYADPRTGNLQESFQAG